MDLGAGRGTQQPASTVKDVTGGNIGGDGGDGGGDYESWETRIERSIAASRKIRGGNYVQLATIGADGLPAVRTVVFRGFQPLPPPALPGARALRMITDARSAKAAGGDCAAEMVWWFAKTSEQYRVRGHLRFIGGSDFNGGGKGGVDDASPSITSEAVETSTEEVKALAQARKQQWGNLRDTAREQFFWHNPGQAYAGAASVPSGGRDAEGTLLPPPDSFLLMLLVPERVHYLRLGDNLALVDTPVVAPTALASNSTKSKAPLTVPDGEAGGEEVAAEGVGTDGVGPQMTWHTARVNP